MPLRWRQRSASLLAFAVFATSALGFPVAHAPAGVNVTARANSGKRGLSFLDAGRARLSSGPPARHSAIHVV